MNEWQPIETAPKDGRRLLAWLGESYHVCVLSWGWDEETEQESWIDAEDFAPDPQPTHWMPLPSPPCRPREDGIP